MKALKLYMLLLGCKPKGRHTEQHDIFFGIGKNLADLKPHILNFWPDAGKIHIDAWRAVTNVDGHAIQIVAKNDTDSIHLKPQLFFLNLGGYKLNEFEEYHYKMVHVDTNKAAAIKAAIQSTFYKHNSFTGATSHIDDKYGVDVDDIFAIEDILSNNFKQQFCIEVDTTINNNLPTDIINLGYLKWSAF